MGNKVGAGGTSLDASLKEVRMGVDRQRQARVTLAGRAATEALGDGSKLDGRRPGRSEARARDRAELKSYGALGDGEYQMWQRENPQNPYSPYELVTRTQKNSDYDGDGRRDPEDGGYDAGPKPEDN